MPTDPRISARIDLQRGYSPTPLDLRPGVSVTAWVRGTTNDDRYPECLRRAYIVGEADTFFSIPARVSIGGRKVAGYLTVDTMDGSSVETPDNPAFFRFVPYRYGDH